MDEINIDDLKDEERIKIEIPIEEEPATKSESRGPDVVDEFKKLGQSLAHTLESFVSSDDARRIEGEVREGVKGFAGEMENFVREAFDNPKAAQLKDEARDMGKRVETSDVTRQAQEGIVVGLRRLSEEMDKLAERFAATEVVEKSPDDDTAA